MAKFPSSNAVPAQFEIYAKICFEKYIQKNLRSKATNTLRVQLYEGGRDLMHLLTS